jgi:adenine-specific DNA-methyltransferase
MNPNDVPKVQDLRKKLNDSSADSAEHENAVFSHLLTFFSRYYDNGDFISQRRYKGDTYAIPYAGEEVVLHWANKDQYYTKSGENFSNYGFKLDDGRSVRFRLISADTAKDNRKDNDKERRFVLIEPFTLRLFDKLTAQGERDEFKPFVLSLSKDENGDEYEETLTPVSEENGELVIRFAYQAMPKGTKQDDLIKQAVANVLNDPLVKAHWLDLTQREPTEKNPQRTLLEKALTNYTSKNTADYFIHKDLGGFLRRELDFYIKNEVMNLDDLQDDSATFADIEKNLYLIKTLRAIALDLIQFLARLEDFQKKLWLKKKFVVASHYCITLDRVPENLYATIAENPKQWQQWQDLGMLTDKIDVFKQAKAGTIEYLTEHRYLMVDTALFDWAFKQTLLASIDNLDDSLDGLLIHGDNFQALNLLQERYREQVKCIYIDPPYNTGGDGFTYKDNYQHSSWMSMMADRVLISKDVMLNTGVFFASIDKIESPVLRQLLDYVFFPENLKAQVIWQKRYTRSNNTIDFTTTVEHIHCYARSESFIVPLLPRTDEADARYTNPDNDSRGSWKGASFLNPATPEQRRNLCYPIVNPNTGTETMPTTNAWRRSLNEFNKLQLENRLYWGADGKSLVPSIKMFLSEARGLTPIDFWSHEYAGNTDAGTAEIGQLFNDKVFQNPKPSILIRRVIEHSHSEQDTLVLDYFAGSGTTAHAVINLNREDSGKRKYILVEQGDYFDTVLKPRIQKVVYSADWKDGNATAPETGISHAFKVLNIESYEDTLNNLHLQRSKAQQDLLDSLPSHAQNDYLFNYLLDIESRGSLLSVEQFNKPFSYSLKITVDSAGAYQERNIDLVETFNYLIGLRVSHIDMQLNQGFVTVAGFLPSGEKTLVLWRDVEQVDYEKLNRLCEKLAINPADSEYEVVYINGDHNIPVSFTNLETEGGITKTLKIRQIEAEFLARMF